MSDQRKKGKSPEIARRICGEIEKKTQQQKSAATASAIPTSLRPAVERSQKALRFLEQHNALVNNTSFDGIDSQSESVLSTDNNNNINTSEFTVMPDEESFADKITRIMDEYNVPEEKAVEVVNRLIEDEQRELERRAFELTKKIELDRANANSGEGGEVGEAVPGEQPTQNQEEEQGQQDVGNNNNDNQANQQQQQLQQTPN